MKAINDFKAFILRGNVVDLAIAVVIGAAFGTIVTAFINDFINPLIAAIGGKPNLSFIVIPIGPASFKIGDFISVAINFLLIAAVVFFFIVRPVNWLMSRRKTELPVDPTTRECPFCLSDIPIKATRCAFCTSEVPVMAEAKVTA